MQDLASDHTQNQGSDRVTLEEALERFLFSLTGKNRSPATVRAYGTDVGQFIAWL